MHLKAVVDVIAPFLTELFNRSLSNGVVPEVFKAAYITPLLKKSDMDPEDVRSFRPISNLHVGCVQVTGAAGGKAAAGISGQVRPTPAASVSIYRACHSRETAVLKVLSDILLAIDAGDLSALVLLDLSAAFDMVDHDVLVRRLET